MNDCVEELSLTAEDRLQAHEHWDALMFAPSRTALESARLALSVAPLPVQQAVMADITAHWLNEYEPQREENPFRDALPIQHPNQPPIHVREESYTRQIDLPESEKKLRALSSLTSRIMQWLRQPIVLGAPTATNSSFQRATNNF